LLSLFFNTEGGGNDICVKTFLVIIPHTINAIESMDYTELLRAMKKMMAEMNIVQEKMEADHEERKPWKPTMKRGSLK
jgi:hypothetical protein